MKIPNYQNFKAQLVIHSPGRINLIGEHTDYNNGFVLPAAIDKAITIRFSKNGLKKHCQIASQGFDEVLMVNLENITKSKQDWHNYLLGVLHEISLLTNKLRGFDCSIESNLPIGSGVSSSAALECGLAFGLNKLFDLGFSKLEIVQLAQRAEHNYVGTQCGIMDQFASVMSKKNTVMLLDCSTLEYAHIPINTSPYKIVMLNTKVHHNLASSEYNVRKKECEEGLAIMKTIFPEIHSLRDVTSQMLKESKPKLSPKVYQRCSFIIDENIRVLQTVEALKANNWKKVGQLLYEGHHGISTQFEVSCPESDFLVDFSKQNTAVLGARQTGGGFGGCTLNIIHKDAVTDFIHSASIAYYKKFNIHLEAFEVVPSSGTSIA